MTLFYNLNILCKFSTYFASPVASWISYLGSTVYGRPLTFISLTPEFLFTDHSLICLPEGATLHMVQWIDEPLTKCLVRLAGQLKHTETSFQAASIIQHVIGHGNCHTALTVLSNIFMATWSEVSLFPKELTAKKPLTFLQHPSPGLHNFINIKSTYSHP